MTAGDVHVLGPFPPSSTAAGLQAEITGTTSVASSITSYVLDGNVWFAIHENA